VLWRTDDKTKFASIYEVQLLQILVFCTYLNRLAREYFQEPCHLETAPTDIPCSMKMARYYIQKGSGKFPLIPFKFLLYGHLLIRFGAKQ